MKCHVMVFSRRYSLQWRHVALLKSLGVFLSTAYNSWLLTWLKSHKYCQKHKFLIGITSNIDNKNNKYTKKKSDILDYSMVSSDHISPKRLLNLILFLNHKKKILGSLLHSPLIFWRILNNANGYWCISQQKWLKWLTDCL